LIDAKKLVPNLTFIERKEIWGVYFQGSVRQIPEEDFRFIESEMKKVISERTKRGDTVVTARARHRRTESETEAAIMQLPLEAKTLHDRLGEMLEEIGSWMGYNTQVRHKITPDLTMRMN